MTYPSSRPPEEWETVTGAETLFSDTLFSLKGGSFHSPVGCDHARRTFNGECWRCSWCGFVVRNKNEYREQESLFGDVR